MEDKDILELVRETDDEGPAWDEVVPKMTDEEVLWVAREPERRQAAKGKELNGGLQELDVIAAVSLHAYRVVEGKQ